MRRLTVPSLLGLLLACTAACTGGGAAHCTRPSYGSCDQPAHRMDSCVCDSDGECESGFCGVETKYCTRVCQWQPIVVAVGERCDCDDACTDGECLEVCPDGAYCKGAVSQRRCAPLEGVGGPCSLDAIASCQAGLTCTPVGASTDGTCQPKRQAGESCRTDGECLGPYATCTVPCNVNGLSCCTGSKLGMSCATTGDCAVQGVFCSQVSHTCEAVRGVGAGCDPGDVAEQCVHDALTRLTATCDPASRTCVGGYCQ